MAFDHTGTGQSGQDHSTSPDDQRTIWFPLIPLRGSSLFIG